MAEKKQLNENELKKINGGVGGDGEFKMCKKCYRDFNLYSVESRKVGSGCDYYYEYKCPECGEWN